MRKDSKAPLQQGQKDNHTCTPKCDHAVEGTPPQPDCRKRYKSQAKTRSTHYPRGRLPTHGRELLPRIRHRKRLRSQARSNHRHRIAGHRQPGAVPDPGPEAVKRLAAPSSGPRSGSLSRSRARSESRTNARTRRGPGSRCKSRTSRGTGPWPGGSGPAAAATAQPGPAPGLTRRPSTANACSKPHHSDETNADRGGRQH
ncbi:hypothetical protein MTO96_034629 [Rhipicephalus appendiculatus]